MSRKRKLVVAAIFTLSFAFSLACEKPASPPLSSSASTPAPVPQPTQVAAVSPPHADHPEDKMPRTKADEAIRLLKAGDAVIIDVRGTEAFKTQHIIGATDFPLDRLEKADFKGLPRNKAIIAYCA